MTEDPRKWLRDPEIKPESYDELLDKLKGAEGLYGPGGASEMRSLIAVFGWCRDNGITLSELEVTKQFAKYQTTSAYLNRFAKGKDPDGSKLKAVREIIARITGANENRRETEEWARGVRRADPFGHKYYLEDAKANASVVDADGERPTLTITGPRETIALVCAAVERYAEWDRPFGELMSELLRGEQTEE